VGSLFVKDGVKPFLFAIAVCLDGDLSLGSGAIKEMLCVLRIGSVQRQYVSGQSILDRRQQAGLTCAILAMDQHDFRIKRSMNVTTDTAKVCDI